MSTEALLLWYLSQNNYIMSKKILRHLSLQKEELVNLNDYQMNSLQGGTGTAVVSKVAESVVSYLAGEIVNDLISYANYAIDQYQQYQEQKEKEEEENKKKNSDVQVNVASEVHCFGGCMGTEVVVRP